jgi:hypothetical protein
MNKKSKKESNEATRASVTREMAKPRLVKSVREGAKTIASRRIAAGKT